MNVNYYGKKLTVEVVGGALIISIGVNVLAHAVAFSDWANPYDADTGDYFRTVAITDPEIFARDVCLAMQREAEDGSSPLSDFLDSAAEDAMDDGSEACEFDQRIKNGEYSPLETWAAPHPETEGP